LTREAYSGFGSAADAGVRDVSSFDVLSLGAMRRRHSRSWHVTMV